MKPTSASVANGTYTSSASYDNDLRLSSSSVVLASTSTTLYATSRSYDGVGNVTSAQTTLAAGTDNQSFCYDEQNRLVWASSQSATGPCGASNTAGSLTSQGAPYTASYSYDALNRLTSSPLGTYTYGDPAHLHAVTAVAQNGSSSYTAAYTFSGQMTCRAPSSSATCAAPNGSKTGAGLGYNNEGQQIGWQNTQQGTPSTTENAAYDGEGHRVATTTSSNGAVISTTDYVAGGLEEVTTAGSTTTLTKYEAVPGVCSIVIVGSGPSETISYVTTDGLGSVSEALDGSGNVTAQQLYGPYGTGRYLSGTMPTAKGYTGQYSDATTGLDYYGARYYDPLVGQFTSADTAGDGLNRYAYVHDEPETATDPTGHFRCDDTGCKRGGGNGGAGGCTFDCGGSGGHTGSGCGGCKTVPGGNSGGPTGGNGTSGGNARTDLSGYSGGCREVAGAPTCAQIANARHAADDYASAMSQLIQDLVGAGILSKLKIPGFLAKLLGGWVSKIPFLQGFIDRLTGAASNAVKGIFFTVIAEATALGALFWVQAHLWSDDMWRNKALFGVQAGLALGIVVAGNTEMGLEAAGLVDVAGGGPEDPVGDVLAAIAGVAGITGNALYFGLGVGQTLETEREDLWGK